MNTIEESVLEEGIARVLREFPEDDRMAVRACLIRSIYGQSWEWVGVKLGCGRRYAMALADRGREALDEAIRLRRLDREAMAARAEALERRRRRHRDD